MAAEPAVRLTRPCGSPSTVVQTGVALVEYPVVQPCFLWHGRWRSCQPLGGRERRSMRVPSKTEWLAIAAIAAIFIAMVPPTPHWRETTSESCHLCGNCRTTVRNFRWWQLESETIEPIVLFPVPDGHEHNWWQYGSSCVSYNKKSAASNASRYRDGRSTWTRDLGIPDPLRGS